MSADNPDGSHTFSRRELFRLAGMAGAAVTTIPAGTLGCLTPTRGGRGLPPSTAGTPLREALETLTAAEADILDAIVARLIPSDENGPGAAEARAAHYIDRALGGALASSREAYHNGLAALDRHAHTSKGAPFAKLSAQEQDAVLTDLENDVAEGFIPNASTFFALVRAHTLEGTFSDPYYGGNANFVGWDLIGYPGVRLAVSANDQRMDPGLTPAHRSAYDLPMFSQHRPTRASLAGGGPDGD